MYQRYRNLPYQLSYSAADHYKGAEIMLFSDNLLIPTIDNPAQVKEKSAAFRCAPKNLLVAGVDSNQRPLGY